MHINNIQAQINNYIVWINNYGNVENVLSAYQ